MANLLLDDTLWTDELRTAFARTCGAVRLGEAMWQRMDREPIAVAQRWCDRLACQIEDALVLVDVARGELSRDAAALAEGEVSEEERRCLQMVLDPGATTFRALHTAIVAYRAESEAWGALVSSCVQRGRHALAELCLVAQERAHARIASHRAWLDVLDEQRVRRHSV